ncbi:MAG: hypothetical protein GY926_09900 [bacterium]|nr:hypothetical protein [bacterium]
MYLGIGRRTAVCKGEHSHDVVVRQGIRLELATDHIPSQRVAIDGIDAAGKTTLADELAELLDRVHRPVLRASIDGFHHPASVRHLRSEEQPAQSYYEDSFDYGSLRSLLFDPLGPGGNHIVRTRAFDFHINRPVKEVPIRVQSGTVLLFDGVFLLRPELAGCWDLSVLVQVDPAISLKRPSKRDWRCLLQATPSSSAIGRGICQGRSCMYHGRIPTNRRRSSSTTTTQQPPESSGSHRPEPTRRERRVISVNDHIARPSRAAGWRAVRNLVRPVP